MTKNRFDGDLGRVPLVFEKNSLTFSGLHLLRQKKKEGVASGDHAPPALRSVSDTEEGSHTPSLAESHTPLGVTLKSVSECSAGTYSYCTVKCK